MKCEKCGKNEANVFYREVINGKEKSYRLCGECAEEMQEKMQKESAAMFPGFFAGDLLGGLLSPLREQPREDELICPLCGSDFGFLAENGKAGCPSCYKAFEGLLEPTFRRLHGTASHRGRIPAKLKTKLSAKRERESLEGELKKAIAAEEYEKAAELRDKLREIRDGGDN